VFSPQDRRLVRSAALLVAVGVVFIAIAIAGELHPLNDGRYGRASGGFVVGAAAFIAAIFIVARRLFRGPDASGRHSKD
jgi:hypothetical protein